jgi:hypothetical protein
MPVAGRRPDRLRSPLAGTMMKGVGRSVHSIVARTGGIQELVVVDAVEPGRRFRPTSASGAVD